MTVQLSTRLDALDILVLRKILRIPHMRHVSYQCGGRTSHRPQLGLHRVLTAPGIVLPVAVDRISPRGPHWSDHAPTPDRGRRHGQPGNTWLIRTTEADLRHFNYGPARGLNSLQKWRETVSTTRQISDEFAKEEKCKLCTFFEHRASEIRTPA